MNNKTKATLEISEETMHSLEKIAADSGKHLNELIEDILLKFIKEQNKPTVPAENKNVFPGVALIKNNFDVASVVTDMQKSLCESPSLHKPLIDTPSLTPVLKIQTTPVSAEKQARRAEIEVQMKEISILLTTAIEDDKRTEYSIQYAILANELESIT
ncbi:MAG: hypothetical protein WDA26_10530 [Pusillimonas sp.]